MVSHHGLYGPCFDPWNRYAVAHQNSVNELVKVSASLRSCACCSYLIYVDFRTMDETISTSHHTPYEYFIVNLH